MRERAVPRVAVISSNPLRGDHSNGMLMSSLFRGWPRDRLRQIYFRQWVRHCPEFDICDDFAAIEWNGRVRYSDELRGDVAGQSARPGARQQWLRRLKRSAVLFPWAKFAYEAWHWLPLLQDRLARELSRDRPDVVYALLGNLAGTRIVTQVCHSLDLPLFVHVTDDFVEGLYQRVPLRLLRGASVIAFQEAANLARGRAAIGPHMAAEYGRRYGGQWEWFTTLVDAEAYDASPRSSARSLHAVYAGNLGLGRDRSLRQFAEGLRILRERRGIDVRLDVYSSPDQLEAHRAELMVDGITRIRGWAAPADLPAIFGDADLLVHAESFEAENVAYVRHSFSTKLSQYLMAGRPVVTLGPAELASVRLPAEVGGGVAIASNVPEEIAARLEEHLADPEQRAACAARGRAWAQAWVERRGGQARFRAWLSTSRAVSPARELVLSR